MVPNDGTYPNFEPKSIGVLRKKYCSVINVLVILQLGHSVTNKNVIQYDDKVL